MSDIINYTNEQFEADVKLLANAIKDEGFDLILGIARGGLYPAVRLSHMLDLPMYAINYSLKDDNRHDFFRDTVRNIDDFKNKKILVVEDIADTGNTLQELFMKHLDCLDAKAAALIFKPTTCCFRPKYFGSIFMGNQWVTFPWESK